MSEEETIKDSDNSIYQNELVSGHHIYLHTFKSPNEMTDIYNTILNTPTNDHIQIWVNSGGGEISGGLQLINTIKLRQDINLVVHAVGDNASMGATFIMAMIHLGHKVIIHPDVDFLFHAGSLGFENELGMNQLQHLTKYFKEQGKRISMRFDSPFLSLQEIQKIFRTDEWVIVRYSGIAKRLQRMKDKLGDKYNVEIR